MSELLNNKEMSEDLKVSRMTLNRWRALGMPSKNIGKSVRFDKIEVYKWIEENNERIKRGE